jgi:glyoxylase-like metal-dependent hydrolase (beta-lactamase superfamily II)
VRVLNRPAKPREHVTVALFLAEHSYINDEVIRMDEALRMPPRCRYDGSCSGRSPMSTKEGVEPTPAIEITGELQHRAWLARTLPPVEQLRTDLWSIPVPIPNNPLRYVSAYVFAGRGGLTLIDTGWDTAEAWDALSKGLEGIGGSVADVRGVLVTHMHFDHIGLAGRVRQASGAWIALHEADRDVLARPDNRHAPSAAAGRSHWLHSLGAPDEATVVAPDALERFVNIALPDRILVDGDLVDVPEWSLRAVHTPGHTPGHLCFADERTGLFFAGDHLLPRISPNISAERLGPPDPLGDFIHSLRAIRDRQVSEVLPAHEWRFKGLAVRVDQLISHHERRLVELLQAVRSHPGSVPWDLAGYLTWSRPWEQYGGHMRIFAVSETTAHLWHLVARGQIDRSNTDVPTYTALA